MATEVLLPQWGMNMQEGTLTRWLKREGDTVAEGEPLVDIETAKINDSLEAPASGELRFVVVPEGETVPVHTLLAVIAAPGEQLARPAPSAPAPPAAAAPPAGAATAVPGAAPAPAGTAAQVVPAARKLAAERGLDLATVRGSGPGGRILEADVRAALEAPPAPAPGAGTAAAALTGLSGIRRTIAERMLHSLHGSAQVTLTTECDVTPAVALRRELVGLWREYRLRPVDQDLILRAVALSLREHPYLNATLDQRGLRQHDAINLGVALALQDGLVVGVVRDADHKDVLTLAREVRALAARAGEGRLTHDDVNDGTFTISSLGQFDIDAFTPIINPPEIAILGVGRVVEKPAVVDGQVVVRSLLSLSLTFDHRAVDGAPAAQFLQTVARKLADPRQLTA